MNDSIADNTATRRFLPTNRYGWLAVAILAGFAVYLFYAIKRVEWANAHYGYPKAVTATLKTNIHQIRNAIDVFKTDTGVYPAALTDLSAADASGVKAKIKPNSYKGPYLSVTGGIVNTGIPANPFLSPRVPLDQSGIDVTQVESHWTYNAREGIVHPAFPREGTTQDGTPYLEL